MALHSPGESRSNDFSYGSDDTESQGNRYLHHENRSDIKDRSAEQNQWSKKSNIHNLPF
jgi:hypothetical protein